MTVLKRTAGFTLVELMCVIAVLAIVTAVGVPSFSAMIKESRLVTATNDLNAILQYARAEAVRSSGRVGVGAIDGNVRNGVRVWVDINGSRAFEDGELVLKEFIVKSAGVTLSLGGGGSQDLGFFFNARGLAPGLAGTVKFGLCDDRAGNHGRQLTLLTSGVLRLTKNLACTGS